VVGYEHEIKGQGIHAYVICEQVPSESESIEMAKAAEGQVISGIGKIARPDRIQFVARACPRLVLEKSCGAFFVKLHQAISTIWRHLYPVSTPAW
jgi:hypothetical protein